MYEKGYQFLLRYFKASTLFKTMFNISPMYSRSTAKIIVVSEDLHSVKIKIPLSYKNKNYVGTIFGGSLFSATDPIFMIQLIQILGNNFVVWDKSSNIFFLRPANKDAFVTFLFTAEEIENIKNDVTLNGEINIIKHLDIASNEGVVFAKVQKTIYIATKEFYKTKRNRKSKINAPTILA